MEIKFMLIIFFIASACSDVYLIGKERKPITPGVALVASILNLICAFMIYKDFV